MSAYDARPAQVTIREAAAQQADRDILSAADAYMVVLTSRYGRRIRRPFLSLHSAQTALKKARENGSEAHLILAKLTPITVDPDLDLDGGELS